MGCPKVFPLPQHCSASTVPSRAQHRCNNMLLSSKITFLFGRLRSSQRQYMVHIWTTAVFPGLHCTQLAWDWTPDRHQNGGVPGWTSFSKPPLQLAWRVLAELLLALMLSLQPRAGTCFPSGMSRALLMDEGCAKNLAEPALFS